MPATPHDRKSGPIVICYDGSRNASEAIEVTAELFPGASVLVVAVWKTIADAILTVQVGPAPPISDLADVDSRQQRAAKQLASDGARRAEKAGLRAEPLAVEADGPIWEAIAEVAETRNARLIVSGASRAGLSSVLLDTLPTALIHRATRPVLVVPSSEATTLRERELREDK